MSAFLTPTAPLNSEMSIGKISSVRAHKKVWQLNFEGEMNEKRLVMEMALDNDKK